MVHHGSLIPLPKVDPRTGDDVNGYKIVAASGRFKLRFKSRYYLAIPRIKGN